MAGAGREERKRQYGSYYTLHSPFDTAPFRQWAEAAGIKDGTVLEPFAGLNNIVRMLQDAGLCSRFACYDIAARRGGVGRRRGPLQPQSSGRRGDGRGDDNAAAAMIKIKRRDTLKSFPPGYDTCITNPPWLARNSARRRNLTFDVPRRYDDVYKYALELALEHCPFVAFIIPATFLRTGLFRDRLESFVLL